MATVTNMDLFWNYIPSVITRILHGIPHLSYKFELLNDPKFDSDDAVYMQSLAIVALMPVAILLISMIGFIIFYCCVGVKPVSSTKAHQASCHCSICLLIIFIILLLGGVGVSVYGTVQVDRGMEMASTATSQLNKSFYMIADDFANVAKTRNKLISHNDALRQEGINSKHVETLLQSVTNLTNYLEELPHQAQVTSELMEWVTDILRQTEFYWTIVTYSLIGCLGMVCLLALLGICIRSKCLLLVTTFIGLLCLVASYLYLGSSLMLDVATADFCMEPYSNIERQAFGRLEMDQVTASYYLKCSKEDTSHPPYFPVVVQARRAANRIMKARRMLDGEEFTAHTEEILENIDMSAYAIKKHFRSLVSDLQCQAVHVTLEDLVPALCTSSLNGLFMIGIAVLACCIALTGILCAAPKTWTRFRHLSASKEELDLDDVFLPAMTSRPIVSRTNNPLFIAPDGRYSRRLSSSSNLPVVPNSLHFFRTSEEDVTLLEPTSSSECSQRTPESEYSGAI